MHPRTKARKHARGLLYSAQPGWNVTGAEHNRHSRQSLPAVDVTTAEAEESEAISQTSQGGQVTLRRTALLGIAALVRADADVEDRLDDMAEKIEEIILPGVFQAVGFKRATLVRSEIESLADDAEQEYGAIMLTYRLEYFTRNDSAQTG